MYATAGDGATAPARCDGARREPAERPLTGGRRELTRMNPEIKVIMFTAVGDPDTYEAFFEAGASAFISNTTVRRPAVDHQTDSASTQGDLLLTQQHRQPRPGNAA
jgi:DNA-binding NarL/FixJ family response regulator